MTQALPPMLAYLAQFLTTANIPAELMPADASKAFAHLMISFDDARWARLYFTNEVLAALGQPAAADFVILELTLPLNLALPAQPQALAVLLNRLNRMLPGPVLLFNEADGVFFKVTWLLEEPHAFWPGLLYEALAQLHFYLPRMHDAIAAVAQGEQKVEAALAEIEKNLATPPDGRGPLIATD